MADEAREYLRAAQQAELRGDKTQAVELLVKAATVYRNRGQTGRALQMLRHASRLDVTRSDISDEVRRMEWMPERPFLRAVSEAEEEAEEELALKPLEDLALKPAEDEFATAAEKQLIERGPTRADPALNAWCSFCCRPKTEVGDLVAGPAGAYVCLTCVRESARLLGESVGPAAITSPPITAAVLSPVPASVLAPGAADGVPQVATVASDDRATPPPGPRTSASVAARTSRPSSPTVDPVGQEQAIHSLEIALRLGVESILLLAPLGSGKTAHLRELERRGMGVYVESPTAFTAAPGDLPVFIDHVDEATAEEWTAIAKAMRVGRSAALILAARGSLPAPELMLARDGEELPLYATAALAEATQGRIPPEVLERVQIAVSFTAPSKEDLVEIARRLAALRASDLDASDELLASMAELAQGSGRLGHELRALLGRLPPGEWTAKKAVRPEPEKKTTRRRKKTEEG